MYQNILIAYDGTEHSQSALAHAARLARLCGARLHLLGVVQTTGAFALAQATGPIDVWGHEHKVIEAALAAAQTHPALTELDVTTALREGDPAAEIVAHAHQVDADLAVLGHSDHGPLMRWLQGSTGARLIAELPCSILIAAGA